jgi:DNA topoisomerase-1
VKGATLRFEFRGKSGKRHSVGINDRRLARIVKQCRDLPGQELFQYVDDNGRTQDVNSADVNTYLREIAGADVTAKDFRTVVRDCTGRDGASGIPPRGFEGGGEEEHAPRD